MAADDRKRWDAFFGALSAYKNLYGTCDVPRRFKPRPDLVAWIDEQRREAEAGTLASDRRRRLVKLGLSLPPAKTASSESESLTAEADSGRPDEFDAFGAALRRETTVPTFVPKTRVIKTPRVFRSRQALPAAESRKRKRREDPSAWNQLYERLVEFHQTWGHARVQLRHDVELCLWLKHQRRIAKLGKLPAEQLEKLRLVNAAPIPPEKQE